MHATLPTVFDLFSLLMLLRKCACKKAATELENMSSEVSVEHTTVANRSILLP